MGKDKDMDKSPMKMLVYLLVIIGAINWGLYGAFEFDLVATLFGDFSTLSRVVYVVVGLAGVVMLLKKMMMMGDMDKK